MAREIFTYTQMILEKVSFDASLFKIELEKAKEKLLEHELIELEIWLKQFLLIHPLLEKELYAKEPLLV